MKTGRIILKHTLTVFNLVNLVLALMIIAVGSYKNLLFILVAILNTLISIINELRAKRTVDKLRLVSEKRPVILKDGKTYEISQKDIKKGDILILKIGDQILVDSEIKSGTIEVNEAFITGEQENILKRPGDKLLSGSFIVSGFCEARALKTPEESLVAKIEKNAKTIKTADSKLFSIMNKIVKTISIVLIPIGAMLLWTRFRVPGADPAVAVTSTVAALINMIPEGLVLLTSSVLALATLRLSKKQVLVQDLYAIETLARVDCIALDKTGTLTTGKMTVSGVVLPDSPAEISVETLKTLGSPAKNALLNALELILGASVADNATSTALKETFLKTAKTAPKTKILEEIPFSSDRKYSGVVTDSATYLMGAPEFLTDNPPNFDSKYRVIAVVEVKNRTTDNAFLEKVYPRKGMSVRTPGSILLGYIILEDELRKDAKNIVNYFYKNDVDLKIISGDAVKTVEAVAKKSGLNSLRAVDLSSLETKNYDALVKNYDIFARVSPSEKKSLINALRRAGKTVAMTGDGVNDILAMKEADVSLAIGEGSDAARRAAKFVLLNSDFSAVPAIIDEGRQSINNLERSAALFLSKTIYAAVLAIIFVLIPIPYPFSPIEMSLLNFLCIGLPGLVLALEKNTSRPKDRFLENIKHYSVPAGLTIAASALILSLVSYFLALSTAELNALSSLIVFTIDAILIYEVSKPLNLFRAGLLSLIIISFAVFILIPFARSFVFLP